ncbi:30S ribosomal protein S18 [endosymbiont DhMRE of Dentiscutata heterogama]|uniref:30S ribosomal protein S18 n=1 Tax=endosymbiont DhMRE of Dentiscutata heterogama TaxID=1609546 RepID=UPI000629D419|nr:30S ribosomal protein S18 [endosymbiont DhMRE of Dentiscutata heterogama]CFW92926.1 30S ribosomal protein S18 [endosymbiont DhMRE of Dentiscutata heterogama]
MTEGNPEKKVKSYKKKIGPQTDYFCREGIGYIDWKDIATVRKFMNKQGRIISRKYSQLTPKNHRRVAKIIKRLRQMALIPNEIVDQSEELKK